jgi:hypothetical protein
MGSLALRHVRRLDGSLVLGVRGIVDDATVELVRLWRRSDRRSAQMRLVAPDAALFRMLELIGLTSQFPTYASMDAALPSPPPPPPPVVRGRKHLAMRPSRRARRRDGEIWRRRAPHLTSLDGAALPRRAAQ